MRAPFRDTVLAAALASLAASASARAQDAAPRGHAVQSHTPEGFRSPEGAGEVARWRAVQANDYAGGNVGLAVYHQIEGEIERASAACAAGQDARARRRVAESRRRHGDTP